MVAEKRTMTDGDRVILGDVEHRLFHCDGCGSAWRLEAVLLPGMRLRWVLIRDAAVEAYAERFGKHVQGCSICIDVDAIDPEYVTREEG